MKSVGSFSSFVVISIISPAFAFPSLGSCNNVSGIDNFDVSSYLGVWYEYSNLFEVFQIGGKCIRANYTLREDEKIGVKNEAVNEWFGNYYFVEGTGSFADPANPTKGELVVSFAGTPNVGTAGTRATAKANYIVVDTDYTSYTIVYSCKNIFFARKESLWILTRAQKPDQSIIDTAYGKASELGLPVSSLRVTDQDGCSALP